MLESEDYRKLIKLKIGSMSEMKGNDMQKTQYS